MENRNYPRYPISVPVYITVEGQVFKKKLRLRSRNISGGGLSFVTRQKLPIDARSKLVISKLGDFVDSAYIEGSIVHIRRDGKLKQYCVGVEFTKFVDVDRDALVARLEEYEARAEAEPREGTPISA